MDKVFIYLLVTRAEVFSAALPQATSITAPASRNATQYNYIFIQM